MSEKIEIPTERMNMLTGKLRIPIHINYISDYILCESTEKTRIILKQLINRDLIEVSKHADDYYVLKAKGNE